MIINPKIVKYRILYILLLCGCFGFCSFADMLSMTERDFRIQAGITKLLWKTTPLSLREEQIFYFTVHSPHPDVAAYALTAAIVRKTGNLKEILEYASTERRGNVSKIGRHIKALYEVDDDIPAQLEKELEEKTLLDYSAPVPDDYYRDIVIYSALIKARKNNIKAIISSKIKLDSNRKALLDYACKPTSQAFDYIFSVIEKQKNKNKIPGLIIALSSYEKVFVKEVKEKQKDPNVSKLAKNALSQYLRMNRLRLSK